jgi:hypothetical protein
VKRGALPGWSGAANHQARGPRRGRSVKSLTGSATNGVANVEDLEVVPGFEHKNLQGRVWQAASEEKLREGLEKAFDCRGDVTIQRKD